jgi:hypothetical protein
MVWIGRGRRFPFKAKQLLGVEGSRHTLGRGRYREFSVLDSGLRAGGLVLRGR